MRHLQRVIGTHHLSVAAWGIYLFLMLPSFIVIPMSFGGRDEIVFPPDSFSLELYRQLAPDKTAEATRSRRSRE